MGFAELRLRNAELAADRPSGVVADLSVTGHGTLPPARRVGLDRMTPPFSQQTAAVRPQVLDQIPPLHGTASVGTSRTPALARRCR